MLIVTCLVHLNALAITKIFNKYLITFDDVTNNLANPQVLLTKNLANPQVLLTKNLANPQVLE